MAGSVSNFTQCPGQNGPMLRAASPPGAGVANSRPQRGSGMRQGLGDLVELLRCGRLAIGLPAAVRFAGQTIGDLSGSPDLTGKAV